MGHSSECHVRFNKTSFSKLTVVANVVIKTLRVVVGVYFMSGLDEFVGVLK